MAATEAVLEQIDAVLARAGLEPGRFVDATYFRDVRPLSHSEAAALTTAFAQAIERLTPAASQYRETLQSILGTHPPTSRTSVAALAGILNTVRADYEAEFMQTLRELIHADLFADFLDMANHLRSKGYKDPAAVLAGSVLEEHLRKLGARHGVARTKGDGSPAKAVSINADLARLEVYGKTTQKDVTAWLGRRNDAAHGHFDRYSDGEVRLMIESIRNFISAHPA